MKTTQQFYEYYRIMPNLQLHQLRVAAVAKMICDDLTREVDTHTVILAGLFHDMGNILKSDLATFPEFNEPEGVAHWQLIKDDFARKYGTDEHHATTAIAREIGISKDAMRCMGGIGFSKLIETRDSDSFEQKICEYADLRVGPHGVLSMGGRIDEASGRYRGRHTDMPSDNEQFEQLKAAAYEIEQQIFAEATIAPEDVTEQSIQQLIAELRSYPVA